MDPTIQHGGLIRGRHAEKDDVDLANDMRDVLCAVGRYTGKVRTTDLSSVAIWSGVMPASGVWTATFVVSAFSTVGDAFGASQTATYKCTVAGGVALIGFGALYVVGAAWATGFVIVAPQTLTLQVQGGAILKTIDWTAYVEVVEAP